MNIDRNTNMNTKYKTDYKNDNMNRKNSHISQSQQSQHIKMSIRLNRGVVTSLTIKKNIITLWLLFSEANTNLDLSDIKDIDFKKISKMVNDFVYDCMNHWENDTGKGLSDFITERMIQDIINDPDTSLVYYKLLKGIKI